ncbi:hypothetical protein EVAR_23593_1 [Eumeta japonica]|uniref:Uncharacterized protein n=1 Tax=Eumeta variegata TaxID=151549 RepID=A0A4C1X1B7_EUMVA|nr:hypothetical protein EVAR_23593_1 [Eumeta japonica]
MLASSIPMAQSRRERSSNPPTQTPRNRLVAYAQRHIPSFAELILSSERFTFIRLSVAATLKKQRVLVDCKTDRTNRYFSETLAREAVEHVDAATSPRTHTHVCSPMYVCIIVCPKSERSPDALSAHLIGITSLCKRSLDSSQPKVERSRIPKRSMKKARLNSIPCVYIEKFVVYANVKILNVLTG